MQEWAYAAARLALSSALPILDCDETFNYAEPLHYLLYQHGLQTWEYSPDYALRSYAYLALYAPASLVARALSADKRLAFFALRGAISLATAACETRFLRSVRRAYGDGVHGMARLFMLCSAGMVHAATAFLPSTFAMALLMLGWACWMDAMSTHDRTHYRIAIGCVGVAVLLGWPFAALAGLPLALEAIGSIGFAGFAAVAAGWGVVISLPSVSVDSYLYGRPVLAALNVFWYNFSVSREGGSQLYGVEPASYYIRNLLLNFNMLLPIAAAAPLAALLRLAAGVKPGGALTTARAQLVLSAAPLWVAFFSAIPHKEERFIFPVYPLLCLAAASALADATAALNVVGRAARTGWRMLRLAIVSGACVLSASRTAALVRYYGAPLRVYAALSHELSQAADKPQIVCVGKEWYRYPSSFFMPSANQKIAFVRAGFGGLLPAPFSAPAPVGTRDVPPHFNDRNQEEPSQYTPLSECDWLVSLIETDEERSTLLAQRWSVWTSRPFLDAARTPAWARTLYVPILFARHQAWAEYAVLRREA